MVLGCSAMLDAWDMLFKPHLDVLGQYPSCPSLSEVCQKQLLQQELQLHAARLLGVAGMLLLQQGDHALQPGAVRSKAEAGEHLLLQLLGQHSSICSHA